MVSSVAYAKVLMHEATSSQHLKLRFFCAHGGARTALEAPPDTDRGRDWLRRRRRLNSRNHSRAGGAASPGQQRGQRRNLAAGACETDAVVADWAHIF